MKFISNPILLNLALLTTSALSCGKSSSVPLNENQQLTEQTSTLLGREEKDRYFRSDASPLDVSERNGFPGLHYFSYDFDYVAKTALNRLANPESIKVPTSTGSMRSYFRVGYFEFQVAGNSGRLWAYQTEKDANRVFIPFADKTTGESTYGGGRYLDLVLDASDSLVLNFNRAYNPWCAYSDKYSCPVPPLENHLSFPIHAGEQLPPRPSSSQ
ncbi:MAG: DUF1684 domain-containing protein [Bacteroidetes bacterium]|nr:DUF1684 domain-containing protein [Bacteroidota bacterium]